MRKPWYRKSTGWWYVTHPATGKQVRLVEGAENREAAEDKWHKLMAGEDDEGPKMALWVLCDKFLMNAQRKVAPSTHEQYQRYLNDLCGFYAKRSTGELRPYDIESWLDSHGTWGNSSRRYAIAAVKRCFNWAVDQGLLETNPVARLRRPQEVKRETLIPQATLEQMLAATTQSFRWFLIALAETGCRPGEVRAVEARHAQLGDRWVLAKHKTAGKMGTKTIYLTSRMQVLTRVLAHYRPTGPLFRNRRGDPWTKSAVVQAMDTLRDKLGLEKGTVAYSLRHTFTTNGLLAGVDSVTMAKLLGHRDTKMISRHYAHLEEQHEHLKAAQKKAAGGGTS